MKHTALLATGFEKHARATRKAEFLAEMERLMPWAAICALIWPHYLNPTAGSAEPFLDTSRRAYRNEMRRWRRLAGKRVGASRTCVPRSSISSSR